MSLETLYSVAAAGAPDDAHDAVVSSFRYPRTDSLADSLENAACRIVLRQEDGWDAVRQGIQSNFKLQAFSGIQDLLDFTKVMERYADRIRLHLMDHLIISRGGLELLVVTLQPNGRGRCAYVELNECRRKLQHVSDMAMKQRHDAAFSSVALAVCTGVSFLTWRALSR
jgi:hypothetical protein